MPTTTTSAPLTSPSARTRRGPADAPGLRQIKPKPWSSAQPEALLGNRRSEGSSRGRGAPGWNLHDWSQDGPPPPGLPGSGGYPRQSPPGSSPYCRSILRRLTNATGVRNLSANPCPGKSELRVPTYTRGQVCQIPLRSCLDPLGNAASRVCWFHAGIGVEPSRNLYGANAHLIRLAKRKHRPDSLERRLRETALWVASGPGS